MKRWLPTVVAIAFVALAAAFIVGIIRDETAGGDVIGDIPWKLAGVSVRLAAPLGQRVLSQRRPNAGASATFASLAPAHPGAKECDELTRLSATAPAREVPWVARRLKICTEPIPEGALRLPILRRVRASTDRLPPKLQAALAIEPRVLRATLARRLTPAASIWLIPGPKVSCIGRILEGYAAITQCQSTGIVARRGLLTPMVCAMKTPANISLVGLAPAGIDRVRLDPTRGRTRTVRVQQGVWLARAPYPLRISYASLQFKTTYETWRCA